MKFVYLGMWVFALTLSQVGQAAESTSETTQAAVGPVASAPQWKASISTTYYNMQGSRAADKDFDYSFGDSWVSLESMNLKYTPAPGWTVSATAKYIDNYYEFQIPHFATQQQRTAGMGDTTVALIHPLLDSGAFHLTGDVGVSLPTGSINQSNHDFPAYHYGYYIQLGSGTYDGVAGLTAVYMKSLFMLGSRVAANVRQATNSNHYREGNLYNADAWADVPLKYGFTPRLIGHYFRKDAMYGADPTLPRQPLTEYYYHTQTTWNVSAALKYDYAFASGVTVGAEAGVPLFQGMMNYDDVQISTNYYGTLSLSGRF